VNIHHLDRNGLHKRAESSSYLPQTGEDAEAMHAEIDDLFTEYEKNDNVDMHLVTLVVRVDT
jgi:hypothetical protein